MYTLKGRENQRTLVYFFKLQNCFFIIYFAIKPNAFDSILLTFGVILSYENKFMLNSNMTSFLCFVNKRAIYWLGIISLATVNVHVDELLSARTWQHKFCATLFANVSINYRLPIKVYYLICTLRHLGIEIIHGSQNVFWVLRWLVDISKLYHSPLARD